MAKDAFDVVVDGADNFPTRYLLADAALMTNTPLVHASILRFEGHASVFTPYDGPCYRCLFPEPPPPDLAPSCGEAGVLGVLCASIGSIQVTEAIKLITGVGDSLIGRLKVYDALEMDYREVKIRKDPNCAVCGPNATVTELIDYDAFCGTISTEAAEAARDSTISVHDLKEMLDERDRGERDFMLIDVREPVEWEIVAIDGAVLIPKGEFLDGSALERLPHDKPIVLHCKVGGRSAEVLAVLKGAGFSDAVHVGGGINAWTLQIEPDKPYY